MRTAKLCYVPVVGGMTTLLIGAVSPRVSEQTAHRGAGRNRTDWFTALQAVAFTIQPQRRSTPTRIRTENCPIKSRGLYR